MDQIDREILSLLQDDGRITATDLAKRVQLSLSATSERLRHLQTSGVIERFTAVVNPEALGRSIEALVDVRLGPNGGAGLTQQELDAKIAELPYVIDAMHLTGRFDTQLRVATRNVRDLDELLVEIREQLGVEETNTRLVLRPIAGFPRALS